MTDETARLPTWGQAGRSMFWAGISITALLAIVESMFDLDNDGLLLVLHVVNSVAWTIGLIAWVVAIVRRRLESPEHTRT